VTAEPGEVNGIEMVIRAAEMADPDGLPGFWDLTRIQPDGAGASESGMVADLPEPSASFALAWHPVDAGDDGELRGEVERQRDFREMRP